MQANVKELFQHLADTSSFQLGWERLRLDLSDAELMEELAHGRDDERAEDSGERASPMHASPPLHH